MKILVLTNMYPLQKDPVFGSFVAGQVRSLRALGMDIDVLFINGRANKLNYFKGVFRFWWQIFRHRYDLIHAHYVYCGWIARLQRKLPIVVSFHGSEQLIPREFWLCKHLEPIVDACTVTSLVHKAQIECKTGRVVPCGVDLEFFKPAPKDVARCELGWDQDKKVMLFVGADRPEKRLDVIRGSFEILKQRRNDVILMLVHAARHEDIPTYLNAADVLVLASDSEGSPMVIKEAMACNLPIVSTNVGDVAEVISGTEGCNICEQTPEDMADKVELALDHGKRTNGRERIQHLGSEPIAKRLIAIYEEVSAVGAKDTNERRKS